MALVDVCRAPVDRDRVSAAERLGKVIVEPEALVVETGSSKDKGGGCSSLSDEILGFPVESAFTSLSFFLLL